MQPESNLITFSPIELTDTETEDKRSFYLTQQAARSISEETYQQLLPIAKSIYATAFVGGEENTESRKFCDKHVEDHIKATKALKGSVWLLYEKTEGKDTIVGMGFTARSGKFPFTDAFMQEINDSENESIGFVQMLRGWIQLAKPSVEKTMQALHVYTFIPLVEHVEGLNPYINDCVIKSALMGENPAPAIMGTAMGNEDDLIRDDTVILSESGPLRFVVTPTGHSKEAFDSLVNKLTAQDSAKGISNLGGFTQTNDNKSADKQETNEQQASSNVNQAI